MDKELEDYLTRKMIIDKFSSDTFDWAKTKYKENIEYYKMKWWKKILVDQGLARFGSKRFNELKEIQSDYIDDLVKTRATLITSKEKQDG